MLKEKLGPIVDAAGHVLEPADTWLKYLDPKYRDRAIRFYNLPMAGIRVLDIASTTVKSTANCSASMRIS